MADPEARKLEILEEIRQALAQREQEMRERLTEGVRQIIDDALQGFSEPPPLPDNLFEPPRASATSSTEAVLTDLHASVDRLAGSEDQVSILNNLADGAARFVARAALFVIRGDKAIGWTTVGFPPGPAEFRRVSVALDGDHVVARAVSARARQEGNDVSAAQPIWDVIGAEGSEAYTALPLTVRDRVAAVLFGDAGDGSVEPGPIRGGALATLARVAEVCLANLSRGQARGVSGLVERRPSQTWEAPAQVAAGAGSTATAAQEPSAAPTPAAEPAPPAPPDAAADLEPPEAARPAPTGSTAGAGPSPSGPDPHEEARRFARLLVSEILLYNEQEVSAGRKNRDLLARLRDDLERSEQVYRQRISPEIADATDYFHDEVVRTLAGGDADLLGAR